MGPSTVCFSFLSARLGALIQVKFTGRTRPSLPIGPITWLRRLDRFAAGGASRLSPSSLRSSLGIRRSDRNLLDRDARLSAGPAGEKMMRRPKALAGCGRNWLRRSNTGPGRVTDCSGSPPSRHCARTSWPVRSGDPKWGRSGAGLKLVQLISGSDECQADCRSARSSACRPSTRVVASSSAPILL